MQTTEIRDSVYGSAFADITEFSGSAVVIDGVLPADLSGTLYYNGPGKLSLAAHLFDGDGAIRSITFRPHAEPVFKQRFVMTKKFQKERHSAHPLLRTFGTQAKGGWLANMFRRPASTANTSVMLVKSMRDGRVRERLLALWETANPWEINPDTLETIAEYSFGRKPEEYVPFGAHPRSDSVTGETFCFGTIFGLQNKLLVYRISENGKLEDIADVLLPRMILAHDFALTPRYLVFVLGPLAVKKFPLKFVLGMESAQDSIEWDANSPSLVVVVPRDGSPPFTFEIPSVFFFHVAGAYDDGDAVVMDIVRYDDCVSVFANLKDFRSPPQGGAAFGTLERLRIDLTHHCACIERVFTRVPTEFPKINTTTPIGKHRYVYVCMKDGPQQAGWLSAIGCVDTHTGDVSSFDFGDGCIAGEVVFAPRTLATHERDGYVLTLVCDAKRNASKVAIFDPLQIANGPVGVVLLPVSAGATFHGIWQKSSE